MTFPFDVAPKEIVWFLLGVLASAAIGYAFYRIGVPKKRLSYSVERRRIVWTIGNYPDGLRITFREKPVTDLSRLVVYIWNSGTQPITRSDLTTTQRLRMIVHGIDKDKILDAGVGTQTRQANNASINDGYLDFDYLNQKDGITVDFFIEGEQLKNFSNADYKDAVSPVVLEGEIIGAQSKPDYVQFSDVGKRSDMFLRLFGGAVVSLVGLMGLIGIIQEGKWSNLFGIVMLFFTSGFVVVGVPLFLLSVYVLVRKPKVPGRLKAA